MIELPTTFGKYFLTDKLATGGMAEIYLAKLVGPGGFEKQLIIKQIHPQLSADRQFVDMFVAEAKTLVSLTHGNIVPIYELGVVDDTYFIAMEYIDGPTLFALQQAVAQRGEHLAAAMAAFIAAEVLKGLDYAHRKGNGLVHRDLSPRNVMLSREGEVKIVDFGIAVTSDAQRLDERAADGLPVGSYPYMSPEQARAEALTGQSDLFTVGVLLWESLTQRSLFGRDTPEDTVRAVLEADIAPPSRHRDDIGDLDEICLRALARDPAERYPSAGSFLAAINKFLYGRDQAITATDVSRLVARYCPPVSGARRAATERPEGDGTAPHLTGEHTRPLPGRTPQGKRRAATRSFATHVHFEKVLAAATPLYPLQAIGPEDEPAPPPASAAPAGSPTPSVAAAASHRRRLIGVGTAVALVAGAIGIVVFGAGRGASAPETRSAGPVIVADAAAEFLGAEAPIDAGAAHDANAAALLDAGSADASAPTRRRPDPVVRPSGTGTLKVGANPWGEVYLDGQKLGRAPGSWSVPAGRHTVVVEFPVPGREQRRQFAIDLAPGEIETLGVVDFSGP